MQFQRNAQVHINIQRIVMGNERTGRSTTGNIVQHRRFDFQKTTFHPIPADGRNNAAALEERIFYFRVHDQIQIPLAVPGIRIFQAMELFGQRQQPFGKDHEIRRPNGHFPHFGAEYFAFYPHDIANVQVFFHIGINAFGQQVFLDINLNAAGFIHQIP